MQSISAIGANSVQAGQSAPSPRLVKAAHEFESQLMKELLKPMTSSDGLAGTEDDSGSGSNNALGEFASDALGKAISEHGGLGIANQIISHFSHMDAHGAASK